MDFKLFTDAIDALEKISKLISIPKNERARYRKAIDETCLLLDSAIVLVVKRLGDALMIDDPTAFTLELRSLDNFDDWLARERAVNLCDSLRVVGREMSDLLDRVVLQDSLEFKRLMNDIASGERELAGYISMALERLAQLGRTASTPASIDNVRITVRGVRKALLRERLHLIDIQTKLLDEVI
jgi:hypothetical protein